MTTYYESAEGIEVSLIRAWAELQRHGIDTNNREERQRFVDEVPTNANGMYNAQDVLVWLGY